MTREERNTKLKHFITCLKCEVSSKECDDNCPVQYEAGNMGEIIENLEAISKALEQEPCPNAISRQAAIVALDDRMSNLENVDMQIAMGFAKGIIYDLPLVNPQTKTGHWIFDEILDKHYYCSECKSMGVDYWDFCPYCGAKMVNPQGSDEKLSWLGKSCKDCGNEKCKKLGTLPRGYDCALWQAEKEGE